MHTQKGYKLLFINFIMIAKLTSNSLINILCKPLVRTSMSGTFVSLTFGLASKFIFGLPLKETLNKELKINIQKLNLNLCLFKEYNILSL